MRYEYLHPLLSHLNRHPPDNVWEQWQIQRVSGGLNNLLYRATSETHDLAIKFCRSDSRDRAGREYDALRLLQSQGLTLAPEPLLLDRETYQQPVVVQGWLDGAVNANPPSTDDEWRMILAHYAAIRRVTPANSVIQLRPAVTNMASFVAGQSLIAEQAALLPFESIDAELRDLLRHASALRDPELPPADITLCRVDANPANFIRRSDGWASVDWENSGWGDPTFEIVDLMTHAALMDVPPERWQWVIDEYARLTDDCAAPARIRAYFPLMLVWWTVRLARYLYEIPRGLDSRLVELAPDWEQDIRRKYQHYLTQAEHELAG